MRVSTLQQYLAILLAGLLCGPLTADTKTAPVSEQISALSPGTLIEVRFHNGKKERGYLADRNPNGFDLKPQKQSNGGTRLIAFQDVRSIRKIERTHTPLAAWVAFGAIVGVAVVALAAYLVFRSNA